MSEELTPEPSDLADDVTQDTPPSHSPVVGRTDFKAWHRTHKHFVREHQWNRAITRLIKQIKSKPEMLPATLNGPDAPGTSATLEDELSSNGRLIRCFTLPGEDLLDLRSALHAVTTEKCWMQFLGFNSDLQSKSNLTYSRVSEAALNMRDRVHKGSTVKEYRFQDIANEQSKAWAEFKKYGPYDWVNLDLCDTMVPSTNTSLSKDTFSALTQLLKYQVKCQTNPWLLFITTQVDRSLADQPGMCNLVKPTIQNMKASPEFSDAIKRRLPSVLSFDDPLCDLAKLSHQQLVDNFGVLLGKWLCSVLFTGSPRCSVRLLDGYKYSINPHKKVDMLSLAFWMKPLIAPPTDSTGLSERTSVQETMSTEIELALALLNHPETVPEVDAILDGDVLLREGLCTSQADLLAGSGYDRDQYLNWLRGQEPSNASASP